MPTHSMSRVFPGGFSEAQKGEKLSTMTEQDIRQSLLVDEQGQLMAAMGGVSLHTLLGVRRCISLTFHCLFAAFP